jgi:putative FmdB family regulatory protein
MPTYSYICDACGHEFEKEQRISEDPIKKCPSCNKSKARRLIISGNFILKGGGWYSDGYSSASARNGGKSTSTCADKSAGGSSTCAQSESSKSSESCASCSAASAK